MAAVVAFQIDGLAPAFDQAVDTGDGQRPAALAFKKRIAAGKSYGRQQGLNGEIRAVVQRDPAGFSGFLFFELKGIAGF